MSKIIPFLWFNGKAEQAMKFYVSIFKDAKVLDVSRDGEKVFSVSFKLAGQKFIGFNGGPGLKFSPAISLFVDCKTQREVDHYWEKLSKGGKKLRCGWLRDPFGITWQIVPSILGDLLQDKNEEKAGRAMEAMLGMHKLDIAELKRAHSGK